MGGACFGGADDLQAGIASGAFLDMTKAFAEAAAGDAAGRAWAGAGAGARVAGAVPVALAQAVEAGADTRSLFSST